MANLPSIGEVDTWAAGLNAFLTVAHETSGANGGKVKLDTIVYTPSPGTVVSTAQAQHRKIVRISDFTSNSLNTAVVAIGSTLTTLYIDVAATCTGPLTIPSNISIIFLREGSIDIVSGILTINGSLYAGLYQIFTGSGTVILGAMSVSAVFPEWWGTNTTPGSTDMTLAIQKALASQVDSRVMYLLGTEYKTTSTIYLSDNTTIKGNGSRADKTSRIKGYHTGAAVVSLKGASFCHLEDFLIQGDATTTPKTGLCLGRSSASSAGSHAFKNMYISGYFSQAAVYSIASEENVFDFLWVDLLGGGAKWNIYIGQSDGLSVDSMTASSNTAVWFNNPRLYNETNVVDSSLVYIEAGVATGLISFRDGFFAQKNNAYVTIVVGEIDGQDVHGPIIFDNIGGEGVAGGSLAYGFYVKGSGSKTLSNLEINNCQLVGMSTNYLYGENAISFNSLQLWNAKTVKPISVQNLFTSIVNARGQTLTVRSTSQGNILFGGTLTLNASYMDLLMEYDINKIGFSGRTDGTDKLRLFTNLPGSVTWDPSSLADGSGETSSSITVSNAAFGDYVLVSAPYDLQGITCNGYVDAANSVKIRLQNETGGTIDLGSGSWKVRVLKAD